MGTLSIFKSSLPYRTAAVIFPFTAGSLASGAKAQLIEALYGAAKAAPFQDFTKNAAYFDIKLSLPPG
jgi:hypothetical protein